MNALVLEKLRAATGLPSPTCLSLRLLECDPTDDGGASTFATLAASDPAMSAAALKFANARMMGRGAPVPTVRDAAGRLGVRAMRVVVFSLMLVAAQGRAARGDASRERAALGGVWARALARGIAARALADVALPKRAHEAFQAGVLAEVSRVALYACDPEAALALAHAETRGERALHDAQSQMLGASAAAASAELLRWWRVPRRVWASVQALDAPSEPAERDARSDSANAADGAMMASLLRAADHVARTLTRGDGPIDPAEIAAELNIDAPRVARALATAGDQWERDRVLVAQLPDESRVAAGLEPRVGAALAELSLATQLENRVMKRRQDELMRRVTTDALTGVKNRLAFDERLEEEVERCQRSSRPLTLLLCDLDGFKRFNDTHGHQAGDLMLRAAAEAILHAARRIDVVARYGGEEFAVIAPQCGHEGARSLAERLRRAVTEATIEWRGKTLSLTVSVGGAVAGSHTPPRSPGELIEAADVLLYQAKRTGRDRAIVESIAAVSPASGATPGLRASE